MKDGNVITPAVNELVARARAAGVELRVEGRRLRFRAAPGALDEELKRELTESRAALIDELRREAESRVSIGDVAENQHGLWLFHRLAPTSAAYNLSFAAWVDGPLDSDLLEESLQVLVDRHESLRTTYPLSEERPVRIICGSLPFRLDVVSADGWSEATLRDRIDADHARPFDLERGPLLRGSLYREADDRSLLLLSVHHIAVDGTSLFLLLQEAMSVYSALIENGPVPSKVDAGEFSDFVAWQGEYLAAADSDYRYWTEALNPPPPTLDLPASRPRDGVRRSGGDTAWHRLDSALTTRLREFSRKEGVTEYMLFLSVWYAFLARLTGESDIVVGTPVQGRPSARFSRTVGDFVNILPLRIRRVQGSTLRQLLKDVQQVVREGISRQDYPLSRMMQASGARETAGEAPYRTLFAFQDFSRFAEVQALMLGDERASVRLGALSLRPYQIDQQQGQLELAIDVWPREDGMFCGWRFDDSLYDRAIIEGWQRSYATLLKEAIADPDTPLDRLPLVSEPDRALLVRWNATERPYPRDAALPELLAAQCGRTPDAVAVRAVDGAYTYAELLMQSQRIAAGLRQLGIGPGSRVGVMVDRGRHLSPALLGVLGSGAGYVPLDRSYPAARVQYMLQDSGSAALVTSGSVDDSLAGALPVLDLSIWALPEAAPFTPVQTEDEAYVIYTSGSTGKPKGVSIPHRALVNLLTSLAVEPGLTADDVLLAVTTISFDMSVPELYLPLIVGGTIVFATESDVVDGRRLVQLLEDERVNVLQATPATWKLLQESGWRGKKDLRAFCGGEALPEVLAEQLLGKVSQLWNLYGPTETTVWSTTGRVEVADAITVGRAIGNTKLYVLDERMQPVPVGVPGELWIGGEGVSRGYVNRPELTTERFVESPFPEGGRLYRTGDLVRFLADGKLQHLGRLDQQVKVRGYRIELGEIETRLQGHDGVRDAVVAASEDRLVAYLVPSGDVPPPTDALRQWLGEALPGYMVPSFFVTLPSLPLTPNGKVDRKALPEPQADAMASPTYVVPRTETESRLAAIWQELLGVEAIGCDDNFFERGGHSLLAARAISRINSEFEVDLPLRNLFETPALSELAATVDHLLNDGEKIEYLPIERRDPGQPAPLSFAQEQLWYLHQLAPPNSAYNVSGAIDLRGPINREALREAFQLLGARHESLRTRFESRDGSPIQLVTGPDEFELELSSPAPEGDLEKLLTEAARRPFDLSAGRLFRATLYEVSDERHVLLFVAHHIVVDGWSLGVMLREFEAAYNSLVRGRPADLLPLPLQYADYAVWQRKQLDDLQNNDDLVYWREKLAHASSHLNLPTDHLRPARSSYRGSTLEFALPNELTGKLKALSREPDATLFMTLLATFQLLLARYSNQDDVVVGTPVANRTRPELEGLIGDFVNTLALRTAINESHTFRDLLREVRATCLGAFAHQGLPFEKLVEALQPVRDLSRNPVFQVMFALQNMDLPELHLDGIEASVFPFRRSGAQMDLTLYMWESKDRLQGMFEYATDLFDEATIARLSGHFTHLLESVVAAPDGTLLAMPMLDDAERREMSDFHAGQAMEMPESTSARFATQVFRTPESLAVRYGDEVLSYAELDRRSTKLARYLLSQDLPPDALVGLYLQRTESLLVGVLGVMKAGAAYLPLDPSFPEDRLCYMLEDSGACLVVTETVLSGSLPDAGVRSVCLDGEEVSKAAEVGALPEVAPESVAYVIYTSGSTGKPKGVEVTHRNLANFLSSMAVEPGLSDADVLCAVTTLSFDIAMLELLLPLTVGATVVVADRETATDGRRLSALLSEQRVNVMQATPATWRLLIESGWQGGDGFKVLCGGEALPADLLEPLEQRAGEVWNLYGPTETTIWSSCGRLEAGETIHIGRPIGNTSIYIVDRQGNLQPIGVPGEIWIGGEGVARGYLGRPELTAERFLVDPFQAGGRAYRTGDLGRWRQDGRLQHLGRMDNQVKVRGFRIEPGEIESRLGELESIDQAVVSVWQPASGDQRLVAYYVGRGEATAAEMRSHLQQTLPEYMIPQFFVALDALPLTPNGKIDRKALPAPQADAMAAPVYSPPRTETEERLAAIWQELLAVEAIGRDDNFFERGGHSLLAARASGRLNVELGIDLPLRAWFEAPTLSELAARVESLTASDRPGDRSSGQMQRISRSGELPLSHAQRRLWFLDHLEPQSNAYVLPSAAAIAGVIDTRIVERSVAEIVRRHESLRTVFRTVDGSPQVVISERLDRPLTLLDLRDLPQNERDGQISSLVTENAREPFDLSEGPLFRIRLVQLAEAEHLFLMAFHHIVFDYWSAALFVAEFSELYNSFLAGHPSPLPEPSLQFVDFAHWQAARLDDQRDAHLHFWKNHLDAHLPPLSLPEDRPRTAAVRGARRSERVDDTLRDLIATFSHTHNVTPAMCMLAVFQVLLHRLSGQEVVQTGLPIAGRDHPGTAGLIGYFVNTVVVRSRLDDVLTFNDFLGQTRDALLGAYEHQEMPFEELVAALDPVRDVNRTPLFQAFFNHIDIAIPELSIQGATITPLMQFENSSKFDLTLYVLQQGESLDLVLDYNALIFDESRMERFMAQYILLAEELLSSPDKQVSALSLVDNGVRPALPDPAQAIAEDIGEFAETLAMPGLADHGDRAAILASDGNWSFLQLSERADRVAALLVNAGIQRGAVVMLHGHRGPMLVCAMLGVLRAGAAFSILDPAYPDARLAACFKAAQPRGILHIGTAADTDGQLQGHIKAAPLDIELRLDLQALEECTLPVGEFARRTLSKDDLAYVAFTSGTTGGVKAIAGTHGPVAHFLAWQKKRFGLRGGDRFSMLSGLAHDPLLRDVFAPLWSGATLCIPSPDVLDDPVKLRRWMQEQEITIAHLTPTRVQALDAGGSDVEASGLRYAFLGGESLRADSVRQLRTFAPAATCVNFYGATETPQAMGYYVVPPEATALRERIPLGHGIDGVQLLIINTQGQLAGVGEPGEIVVRTRHLSRGYLGDPELSNRRFCPNPFGNSEEDRIYRTGDRGRYLPDGAVEFAGRLDNQIKLRGFRIEPEEIDSLLCESPSVSAAATVLYEAEQGDSRLVSYLVLNKGQSSVADIRKRLRGQLPDYMIPQQFIVLDSIPVTPNGKLDRKALPPPQQQAAGRPESVEAPQSPTEQLLAEIWKDVIGCESISRTDNFFDLGGHSMLVIKAIARVEAKTGWRPSPRLFILENLAEIAAQCDLNGRPSSAKKPLLARFRTLFNQGTGT